MPEREAMHWLQLSYKVPSEPSQKRVWVWRRLQNLGALALQNSVYLLPFSPEVEKQFRLLAQDVRDLGGEASIFAVTALEAADEQRLLAALLESREGEYNATISACRRFLSKAWAVVEGQEWSEQIRVECAELLEKIHVLFRQAKRHDLLVDLTATMRASAAEALAACEQVFRFLLNHEYGRARRTLEQQNTFLHISGNSADVLTDSALLASLGPNDAREAAGQ